MGHEAICGFLFWVVAISSLSGIYAQDYKTICYYTNWSQFRTGVGRFTPADIDASLCTHLVYSFANIRNNGIVQGENPSLYSEFISTKQRNPDLKALLAVGGWTAGVRAFQNVAQSPNRTAAFADNATSYLRNNGFDGLDIDWEYPSRADRDGLPRDKIDFTNFIKAIYEAFQREPLAAGQERLLLSAAIYVYPTDLYEVNKLGNYLDIVNIMAYDIEGSWNIEAGMNAPINAVLDSVDEFVSGGVPPNKLFLGLGFYGRSFNLLSHSATSPGSPTFGPGSAGMYTQEAGFLAYYEICNNLQSNGWTRKWWGPTSTPYAFSGTDYVGYDDLESLEFKVDYIRSQNLGGAMIWAVELDDFGNLCGDGEYPLLRGVNQMLNGSFVRPSTTFRPSTVLTTASTPITDFIDYRTFCQDNPDSNYRDRLDCSNFFTCLNGQNRGIQPCPGTLVFNERIRQCDYLYNVPECQETTTQTTPTTTRTSPTTSQTTPITTRTTPTTSRVTSTTTETTPTTTRTSPITSQTTPITTRTTPTTSRATSTTTRTTPTTTRTTSTTSRITLTTSQTTPTTTTLSSSLSRFCLGRTAGLHIYPDDCHYLVACTVGRTTATRYKCPPGTAFTGQFCDWESNVASCKDGKDTQQVVECRPNEVSFKPHPTDCASYYWCSLGSVFKRTCARPLVFSPRGYCTYAWLVTCSQAN